MKEIYKQITTKSELIKYLKEMAEFTVEDIAEIEQKLKKHGHTLFKFFNIYKDLVKEFEEMWHNECISNWSGEDEVYVRALLVVTHSGDIETSVDFGPTWQVGLSELFYNAKRVAFLKDDIVEMGDNILCWNIEDDVVVEEMVNKAGYITEEALDYVYDITIEDCYYNFPTVLYSLIDVLEGNEEMLLEEDYFA